MRTMHGGAQWGLLLLFVALAACETTGNPREGGLFGWSDKKAMERQRDLEQKDLDAQRDARDEDHRKRALQSTQQGLAKDEARLKQEIEQLLDENSRLEAELASLVNQEQLRSGELTHFNEVLSQNKRLREDLRARSPGGGSAEAVPNALSQQNQRLHQEILALLRR